jgi:hypothetical protein
VLCIPSASATPSSSPHTPHTRYRLTPARCSSNALPQLRHIPRACAQPSQGKPSYGELLETDAFKSNTIDTAWLDGVVVHQSVVITIDPTSAVINVAVFRAYKQIIQGGIANFKDNLGKDQLSTLPLKELQSIPVVNADVKYSFRMTPKAPDTMVLKIGAQSIEVRYREQADGSIDAAYGVDSHQVFEYATGEEMVAGSATLERFRKAQSTLELVMDDYVLDAEPAVQAMLSAIASVSLPVEEIKDAGSALGQKMPVELDMMMQKVYAATLAEHVNGMESTETANLVTKLRSVVEEFVMSLFESKQADVRMTIAQVTAQIDKYAKGLRDNAIDVNVESTFVDMSTDLAVGALGKANPKDLQKVYAMAFAHEQLKGRNLLVISMLGQLSGFQERFGVEPLCTLPPALNVVVTHSQMPGAAYKEVALTAAKFGLMKAEKSFDEAVRDLKAELKSVMEEFGETSTPFDGDKVALRGSRQPVLKLWNADVKYGAPLRWVECFDGALVLLRLCGLLVYAVCSEQERSGRNTRIVIWSKNNRSYRNEWVKWALLALIVPGVSAMATIANVAPLPPPSSPSPSPPPQRPPVALNSAGGGSITILVIAVPAAIIVLLCCLAMVCWWTRRRQVKLPRKDANHWLRNVSVSAVTADDHNQQEPPVSSIMNPPRASRGWDWSDENGPTSAEALIALLLKLAAESPRDVVERYGLLESLLCIIGRQEFELDLPSASALPGTLEPAPEATAAHAALSCLLALCAPGSACRTALLLWLGQHMWAAHDLVCILVARREEAHFILVQIAQAAPVGMHAVASALKDACVAAAVYNAPIATADSTTMHSDQLVHSVAAALAPTCRAIGLDMSSIVAETLGTAAAGDGACFQAEVRRLVRAAVCAWQTLPSSEWPATMPPRAKKTQTSAMDKMFELRATAALPETSPQQRRELNRDMAVIALDGTPAFLDAMVHGGVFAQTKAFSSAAIRGDAALCEKDEFQAGRNAWACFGLQLVLLGVPVDCNAAVVGYSMLYPYSDNLLDDPTLTKGDKLVFQALFRQRLAGAAVSPPSGESARLCWEQVRLIESMWPRHEHGSVYHSLVAISDAQTHSLQQHVPPDQARYGSILDITVEKGGTSVLADLLVCVGGRFTRAQAAYAFHLGVALQLVDDLQDVDEDLRAGQQTLFTVPAALHGQRADRYARRLAHMLIKVIDRPVAVTAVDSDSAELLPVDTLVAGSAMPTCAEHSPSVPAATTTRNSQETALLQEGMLRMCLVTALKAVMRAPNLFSDEFLCQAATRCPLPRAQMAKLSGMRTLMKLVKADAL